MENINLEDILKDHAPLTFGIINDLSKRSIISAMKEACRQTLELATITVELDYVEYFEGVPKDLLQTQYVSSEDDWIFVDKQSILNTINLIK